MRRKCSWHSWQGVVGTLKSHLLNAGEGSLEVGDLTEANIGRLHCSARVHISQLGDRRTLLSLYEMRIAIRPNDHMLQQYYHSRLLLKSICLSVVNV